MNRNLLFAALFLFFSWNVFAQKDFETASHIISIDSSSNNLPMRGKRIVRLYPNPSYGKLSVSANTSLPLHFYVFDMEGTLVFQAVLNNKEKKIIDHLKKGIYLYNVFEKDESTEEGRIIIK